LIVASWSEDLQREVGLKGASQIWTGPPAWYLWLEQAPGAYRLEMVTDEARQNDADGGPCALFSIKLYPYRQHPMFELFSRTEKELTQSRLFDHTHTPTFEAQDRISPDLFTVAFFTVSTDRSGQIVRVGLESMEPLRTVDYSGNGSSGTVLRNLSGMEAGYPLFDVLLCLCSFTLRQAPIRVRIAGSPGFEFHLNQEEVTCEPSDDITGYCVSVWYPGKEDSPAGQDCRYSRYRGKPPLQAPQWRIYEQTYPCGHFHPPGDGAAPKIRLNETWWSIAGARHRSHLASACGCSLESHGV